MIAINYLIYVAKRGVAFVDPVAHNVFVLSTKLRKEYVSYPGAVSVIVAGVAYDSVDVTEFPAVSKESQHNATDYLYALGPPILVDYGWWSVVVVSCSIPSSLSIRSAIVMKGRWVLVLVVSKIGWRIR